ncbi:hypothetical protein KOW79_020344 [Hemibagrus wyckioides]|uniref:Uncharacterized protein n=1 Tax=Hemibagrus wyckioides TaxID=337641 RepID=A0A9D3SEI1_9TELE|nr:hypothetical protein KOW79_020344 [Hemibagrus wyckioides]
MARDPTHDYSHKELAKILGSLAHNLFIQAKGGEASISRLEQESAALKIQAGESQRNLEIAHCQLDQLTTEKEHRHRMAAESIGVTVMHGPGVRPDTPVDPGTTQGVEPPGTAGDGPWEDDVHQHEPQDPTTNGIISQHGPNKPRYGLSVAQDPETPETAEILKALKEIIQERCHNKDKRDKPDQL